MHIEKSWTCWMLSTFIYKEKSWTCWMLSTYNKYKEKSWTCWMLSILQRKSWTCSGNVKVFLEFNDCVQLNQVRISMLHCEMLHYLKRNHTRHYATL